MRNWFQFINERFRTGVVIDRRAVMTPEADIVREFIGRWGLVAATPDGEDSAGRSKFRLQTPAELVDRALSTTKLMMEAIEKEGWIVDITPENTLEPSKDKL